MRVHLPNHRPMPIRDEDETGEAPLLLDTVIGTAPEATTAKRPGLLLDAVLMWLALLFTLVVAAGLMLLLVASERVTVWHVSTVVLAMVGGIGSAYGLLSRWSRAPAANRDSEAMIRSAERARSDVAALALALAQDMDRMQSMAKRTDAAVSSHLAGVMKATKTSIADIGDATDRLREALRAQTQEAVREMEGASTGVTGHINTILERMAGLLEQARQSVDIQAGSVDAVLTRTQLLTGTALDEAQERLRQLAEQSGNAAHSVGAQWAVAGDAAQRHVAALERASTALAASGSSADAIVTQVIERLDHASQALMTDSRQAGEAIDTATRMLADMLKQLEDAADPGRTERIAALTREAGACAATLRDLAPEVESSTERLRQTQGAMDEAAQSAARAAQTVDTAAQALTVAMDGHMAAAARTASSWRDTLVADLAQLDTLAEQVARRAEDGRRQWQTASSVSFQRNTRHLIEKLQSQSIDVSKAFGIDLTDADWRAYLAGDRSLFNRRVSRAIGAATRRELAQQVAREPEFRDAAVGFVVDFEKLIAQALGQDEAEPLALALVSSDLGKLYVALKQALSA